MCDYFLGGLQILAEGDGFVYLFSQRSWPCAKLRLIFLPLLYTCLFVCSFVVIVLGLLSVFDKWVDIQGYDLKTPFLLGPWLLVLGFLSPQFYVMSNKVMRLGVWGYINCYLAELWAFLCSRISILWTWSISISFQPLLKE